MCEHVAVLRLFMIMYTYKRCNLQRKKNTASRSNN
jgi:hypothetical protein